MPCPFRIALTVFTVALGGILCLFHFARSEVRLNPRQSLPALNVPIRCDSHAETPPLHPKQDPEEERKRLASLQSTADEPETRCPYTKSVRWVRRTSMSLASYTPFAAFAGLTPDSAATVPLPFSKRSLQYRVFYVAGVILLIALHVELLLGPTPVAHAARHWVRGAAMGDSTAVV